MKTLYTYLLGLLFGFGITLSGMINPGKVINFFDIAGDWDPSLMFVMGGALLTTAVGYRMIFGSMKGPVYAAVFEIPTTKSITWQLLAGSGIFGIGWGIAGFCPGGALPALGLLQTETFLFVAAMALGMICTRYVITRVQLRPVVN